MKITIPEMFTPAVEFKDIKLGDLFLSHEKDGLWHMFLKTCNIELDHDTVANACHVGGANGGMLTSLKDSFPVHKICEVAVSFLEKED